MKRKILIYISSNLYIRNYISTNVFAPLEAQYECYYLLTEGVQQNDFIKNHPRFLGAIKMEANSLQRHHRLFNVLMWRHRNRSRSFYFRFLRLIHIDLLLRREKGLGYLKNWIKFLVRLIRDKEIFYCFILGNKWIFDALFNSLFYSIPIHADLNKHILSVHPDLIIFPSSAYDPIGNDIIRIATALSVPTFFLIDNWDNLSSKSVYYIKPDFLGVWGPQSKEHAKTIHDFSESRIYCLGTPRFDKYYELASQQLESHFNFEYVLYVGCAIAFDEATSLKLLNDEITGNPDIYGNLKIIYRPHPWRQPRDIEDYVDESKLTAIIIDPQIKPQYQKTGGDKHFQPDLGYYPSLLSNARFIVGPLTTMLIEAMIFYKKILVITYNDGIHFTSPHNAYKYYEHFRGLDKVEGLTFAGNTNQFPLLFRKLFHDNTMLDKNKLEKDLKYFLFNDESSYSQRLVGSVDTILDSIPKN
ncbi:MAG: hypothetical protein HQM12_15560 [SAR324 cluster bacterium]|nr:hypothetical protein [SAR324 cluster bacterium]